MKYRRRRCIEPEILDDQRPENAQASLRDLVRINRLTGGHKVIRLSLGRLFKPDESFRLLDVGAAMGDAAVEIRKLYPNAHVVSLDHRKHHVEHAPKPRVVGDAFRLPFAPGSFDVVYCGLFLHHFENDRVVELLRSFGHLALRYVIVNDLERSVLPYYFLPATAWLLRWDPITLHDGPISVQAAFTRGELHGLAEAAGLRDVDVRVHRPAFRLSMVASPPDVTLGL
jgi:2-polyprenyl-3-methyl-5-hydroxy-6-metoxy-1,4-benzoquinol methylase